MTIDDLAVYLFRYEHTKGWGKKTVFSDDAFITKLRTQIFGGKLRARINTPFFGDNILEVPEGKDAFDKIEDAIVDDIKKIVDEFYKNEREKKLIPHAATIIFHDIREQIEKEKLQADLAAGAGVGAGVEMATKADLDALAVRVAAVELRANTIERDLGTLMGRVDVIEPIVTRHTGEILALRNDLNTLRAEFNADHAMLLRHDAAIVPGAAAAALDHDNILRTKAILNQLDQYVFNAIRNTQGGTAHKPEDLGFPKNNLRDNP